MKQITCLKDHSQVTNPISGAFNVALDKEVKTILLKMLVIKCFGARNDNQKVLHINNLKGSMI